MLHRVLWSPVMIIDNRDPFSRRFTLYPCTTLNRGWLPGRSDSRMLFISSWRRAIIDRADLNSCSTFLSFSFSMTQFTLFKSILSPEHLYWLLEPSLTPTTNSATQWSSRNTELEHYSMQQVNTKKT